MGKPRDDSPITASDIGDFVKSRSDFAFEMQTLTVLCSQEYECEHGGTFVDPQTNKRRQFDIRAHKEQTLASRGESHCLWLAVECKNLRETAPLLVHTVPRTEKEAHNDVIYRNPAYGNLVTHTAEDRLCGYHIVEPVGKRTDQITRRAGEVTGGDTETYDKMTQALNSTPDLLNRVAAHPERGVLHVIVPMLVVPSGRLWRVEFSPDGEQTSNATQVPHVTVYLDRDWQLARGQEYVLYRVSHLEVVTLGALVERLKELESPHGVLACGHQLRRQWT